ncbi:type III-A CRISPR-associated protein Cas10/Csm1 [Conservatibacter flavescens]|uniref:CRISPR system single-strand-specific deoxyribonuclease Cas10/Csm1 (subtype III-A) n=1 Tax=Conservatibacter flavescens TaxID=28161 RepID=A0A2M8S380_9PAST|nr:type III-A CRISPR-associated protein Cas10/Csm1 [Conservatibacter flavescens]PJG85613.1 type III-A CRISPR-associated protein Cas10/Csm1 [Conservatibacter flavescens]
MNTLLSSSCRVAFAALIHDLGKLAQRAKLPISADVLDAHKTLYCPFNQEKDYHSHLHAAYTGFAVDLIERYLPDLIKNDVTPFKSRSITESSNITDSLINAASAHHKPDTFLQWIIATADRVASGFERDEFEKYYNLENSTSKSDKNHYQARLLTLFEAIRLGENRPKLEAHAEYKYAYPLAPLNAKQIFPAERKDIEPTNDSDAQAEYLALWEQFVEGIKAIPESHKQRWELWLDHFDTAYQCFTSNIPSATAFGVTLDVSLYDHSKTTAVLATALWRWFEEQGKADNSQVTYLQNREASWNDNKFLLIQGDFFGIQDFIFSGGSETNKQAAKLLRGRSFQVSLFTELAALKILQACQLPATSQIMNAAGKFLIVAPNTEAVRQAIETTREELNQWAVEHTYGLIGIGIATTEACCNDFIGKKFEALQTTLFQQLEVAKLQRLDLTDSTASIQEVNYHNGVCRFNHYFPATDEKGQSTISADQIKIGELLTKKDRLLICNENSEIYQGNKTQTLSLPIFGYRVVFTDNEEITGKFGELVAKNQLYRVWDFSLPQSTQHSIWNGYARRYINAYIPLFKENDYYNSYKYKNIEEIPEQGKIKTLDFIACEDRIACEDSLSDQSSPKFIGQTALMTLKGDVDNLGTIFQKGLENPSFAKIASLSRQMNQFFSLWLPAYCAESSQDMYTVFAGGDDFFLIGSWKQTQHLAYAMQQKFAAYVVNPEIHFSSGLTMTKVGHSVPHLGELAEEALEKAKKFAGKNAVTIYNRTIGWGEWQPLVKELGDEIERLAQTYHISTSYLYSLIRLSEQAEKEDKDLEATLWRSRFYYRTARYVTDKLAKEERSQALNDIATSLGEGIANYKINFAIPLFNYFYQKR